MGTVDSRNIAVTSIDDHDGLRVHYHAQLPGEFPRIGPQYPPQNRSENADPKQADPKKRDPKKEHPKKEDPKKEDPEKEDPEKADTEKADPEKEDPNEGHVTNKGIAVPSVDNDDGIRIDYYQQYNGNGSTDGGWPEKDKWISFRDMWVLKSRSLTGRALLKIEQVQQQ